MSYVTHEEEIDGFTIKIIQNDDNFNDPVKEWDLVGRQVYWHNRYSLGHEHKYKTSEQFFQDLYFQATGNYWEDVENEINENPIGSKSLEKRIKKEWDKIGKSFLILPVYAYEHGGITIRANSKGVGWDSFDSGQLGFVYASHEKILEEFGGQRITKKLLERAEKCLIAEVDSYDDYLTGNVWGFQIEDENGEILDSCWGFIGDWKFCLEEAKSNLDYHIKEREKEMKLLDKRMVGEPA